ncbi:transposable element Tc1 transposase [Trichonephila clavipes]|nr:transposable element Tc1 transposase [Trichonephila clavipes]
MPFRRIRANHEQPSEFERGGIIGLKERLCKSENSSSYGSKSGWNHADWGRIDFSDESRFHLCPDDPRIRVWRQPGQRADPAFTIARHTDPQPYVMLFKRFLGQLDPSPSEYVSHMMGRRMHLPGNVDDLPRQLETIWQEIRQKTIRVLYHSVPRRVAACIQPKFGSTPY